MTRHMGSSIGLVMAVILSGCSFSFFNAATKGDTEQVLTLLHDGTDVNTAFPIVKTRPLMVAAAFGHVDTVKVLLDAGADVNAKDLTGWTPLHAAAFNGNLQIVRLLLEKGACAEPSKWYLESPWVMAQQLGYMEIVPFLKQAELHPVEKCGEYPSSTIEPFQKDSLSLDLNR